MDIQGMVFDLDGTLVDSLDDIATCLNVALVAFDLEELQPEWVRRNLGHGARHLVQQALAQRGRAHIAEEVVAEFVRYYEDHPVSTTTPYPGVRRLLKSFHEQGIIMAVSSNKPASITGKVIDILNMAPLFRHIWGGDSFAEKKPSPLALQHFIACHDLPPESVLMVGDSRADILAAKNAGVRSCFFTGGYGALDPTDSPPDFTINAFTQLDALIPEARSRGVR
jgi:phosphoglycolate phosphatase